MRLTRYTVSLFLMVLLLAGFAGCSDDDNPADTSENEHHLESVGVRVLDSDNNVLVEANGTEVTGSIEVHEGGESGFLTVLFLDPDTDEWYDPEDRETGHEEGEDHHHELVVTLTDTDLLSVTLGEEIENAATEWGFLLEGLEHGETTLRIQIYHEDHPDYTSPLLPVAVEHHEHLNSVGVALVADGTDLVVVNGTSVTGELTVAQGASISPIDVFWIDADGNRFQPDAVEQPDYQLEVESDAATTASTTLGDGAWQFSLNGIAAGSTEIHVRLLHGDHAHGNYAVPVTVQ